MNISKERLDDMDPIKFNLPDGANPEQFTTRRNKETNIQTNIYIGNGDYIQFTKNKDNTNTSFRVNRKVVFDNVPEWNVTVDETLNTTLRFKAIIPTVIPITNLSEEPFISNRQIYTPLCDTLEFVTKGRHIKLFNMFKVNKKTIFADVADYIIEYTEDQTVITISAIVPYINE